MDKELFAQARVFMFTDVQREIGLAYASEQESGKALLEQAGVEPGGGNFMAALALLCYTEFGGKLKYGFKKKDGSDYASKNFNHFFDELGEGYKAFRAAGNNVYDIFRCGLVHEYYVKENCTIYTGGKCGDAAIGKDPQGKYYFVVEQYCQDLERAFEALEDQLFPNEASSS